MQAPKLSPHACSRWTVLMRATVAAITTTAVACGGIESPDLESLRHTSGAANQSSRDSQLEAAAGNLLVGAPTEKDLKVLLTHADRTNQRSRMGNTRLKDGSTLLYTFDSESGRVWGYNVVNARKERWVDCPQPDKCSTGTGETFGEHFFRALPR